MTHLMIYKDIKWLPPLNSEVELPGQLIRVIHRETMSLSLCLHFLKEGLNKSHTPELRKIITAAPCGEGILWLVPFHPASPILFLYLISLFVPTDLHACHHSLLLLSSEEQGSQQFS